MELVSIAERTITVDLDPEDCLMLARTCRIAVSQSCNAMEPGEWMRSCEVMAAAMEAAAMAGALSFDGDHTLAKTWAELGPTHQRKEEDKA